MYQDTVKQAAIDDRNDSAQVDVDSKVNDICDAFLRVLNQPSYRDIRLQNIITAHASKTPPDLETGLILISQLHGWLHAT